MNTAYRALVIALLAAVVILTGMLTGCESVGGGPSVRGSGTLATEKREVSGFTDIRVHGSGDVTVDQTGSDSLSLEAEDNILPLLETTVRDGVLHLGTKANVNLHPTRPIRYQVTVRRLTGFGISGSGSVKATNVDTDRLSGSISGSGSATLAGRADSVDLRISGSGSYDAANLQSKSAKVSISGSGDAVVNATDSLDASVSGSGSVHYVGKPSVRSHVSGSGTVASR
jgi:hypothetical protein